MAVVRQTVGAVIVRARLQPRPEGAPVMRSRRLAVIAVVAPLVLAACGASSGGDESVSPLQELFGGVESPAESRAKQLETEEFVAQCMRDEGWEYTPVDYSAQFNDEAYEDPSAPGYGAKYGYGIVRSYELYEWPYIDEDGNYTDGGPFGGGSFEDPNAEYVNALGPDEMTEYYAALYGDQSNQEASIDAATGEEVFVAPPLEEQGCYGQAQMEVYGDQPFNDEDFSNRFSELSQELENDPALEDAEIDWSDCVYEADPAYDFYGVDDARAFVDGLLAEAKGLETMPVDPDTGMVIGGDGSEMVNMMTENADGEMIGYVGQPRKLTEAEMADIQEQEIALWQVDDECQDEVGMQELRRDLEQELVDMLNDEFPDLAGNSGGGVG